jgi:hypothetical protein
LGVGLGLTRKEKWSPGSRPKHAAPLPLDQLMREETSRRLFPKVLGAQKKVEFRLGKGPSPKERPPPSGPLERGLEAQGSKALGKKISRAEGAVSEPVDRDDMNQILETTFFPPPSSWNCSELLMGFPCDFWDICYKICRGLRPEEVHTKCPVHLRLLGSKSVSLALSCLV